MDKKINELSKKLIEVQKDINRAPGNGVYKANLLARAEQLRKEINYWEQKDLQLL